MGEVIFSYPSHVNAPSHTAKRSQGAQAIFAPVLIGLLFFSFRSFLYSLFCSSFVPSLLLLQRAPFCSQPRHKRTMAFPPLREFHNQPD